MKKFLPAMLCAFALSFGFFTGANHGANRERLKHRALTDALPQGIDGALLNHLFLERGWSNLIMYAERDNIGVAALFAGTNVVIVPAEKNLGGLRARPRPEPDAL